MSIYVYCKKTRYSLSRYCLNKFAFWFFQDFQLFYLFFFFPIVIFNCLHLKSNEEICICQSQLTSWRRCFSNICLKVYGLSIWLHNSAWFCWLLDKELLPWIQIWMPYGAFLLLCHSIIRNASHCYVAVHLLLGISP